MAKSKNKVTKPVAKKAAKPVAKVTSVKKENKKPEGQTHDIVKAVGDNQKEVAKLNKGNTTKFQLVPLGTLPDPVRRRSVNPYPFAQMEVGVQFKVDAAIVDRKGYVNDDEHKKAQYAEVMRVYNRVSGAIRRYTRKNPSIKISACIIDNAVRVDRTA